jgi:hypothetical protein
MHSLALVLMSAFMRGDATLDGGGGFVVRVNEQGVLTGVPLTGLHPDLGPRILIPAGFHEWWSVDFMDGNRHASGAASGDAPDWGGRPPVKPRNFSISPERVGIRKLRADAREKATPSLGALLEVTSVDGAAVMHPGLVMSLSEGDVECDVIRLRLTNKGNDPIQFDAPYSNPTEPFFIVEAMVDGDWKVGFPVADDNGNRSTNPTSGFNGAIRPIVVGPGSHCNLSVNLERWRYSICKKLRICLDCERPSDGARKVSEEAPSNGFFLEIE